MGIKIEITLFSRLALFHVNINEKSNNYQQGSDCGPFTVFTDLVYVLFICLLKCYPHVLKKERGSVKKKDLKDKDERERL